MFLTILLLFLCWFNFNIFKLFRSLFKTIWYLVYVSCWSRWLDKLLKLLFLIDKFFTRIFRFTHLLSFQFFTNSILFLNSLFTPLLHPKMFNLPKRLIIKLNKFLNLLIFTLLIIFQTSPLIIIICYLFQFMRKFFQLFRQCFLTIDIL